MIIASLALFASLVPATIAPAQSTWYVDQSGGGDFLTIMAAIQDNAVAAGDRVIVQPGTYFETITFLGKDLELISAIPSAAVIDGSGTGPIVKFENGETGSAVLDGFVIQNGSATNGGGIYLFNYASPRLRNLQIKNCSSTGIGAGVYGYSNATIDLESVTIEGCYSPIGGAAIGGESTLTVNLFNCNLLSNVVSADCGRKQGGALFASNTIVELHQSNVSGNQASGPKNCYFDSWSQGGGVYCNNSTVTVSGTAFADNWCSGGGSSNGTGSTAYVQGGGIFVENSSLAIQDSSFSGNYIPFRQDSERRGPALYARASSITMTRVLVTGNNEAGGIYSESCPNLSMEYLTSNINLVDSMSATASIQNSILWGTPGLATGLDAQYCCIEGGYPGLGNITLDPLFVDIGIGDYRLQELSPCIDRGNPASDLDPDGTRADMGTYWFDQRTTDFDSDDDGLSDYDEINLIGTDPNSFDTDADGVSDGVEYGVTEPTPDTNLSVFIPDADPLTTTDPLKSDSDGGGMSDGYEDFNHDGAYQHGEFDPNQFSDDRFRLTVPPLIPGTTISITVGDGRPGSTGALFYSLAGPGPTATPYGFTFDLSTPFVRQQIIYLSGGNGTFSLDVPPQAPPGLNVWMQAVEKLYYVEAYRTSDAWAGVIQ